MNVAILVRVDAGELHEVGTVVTTGGDATAADVMRQVAKVFRALAAEIDRAARTRAPTSHPANRGHCAHGPRVRAGSRRRAHGENT